MSSTYKNQQRSSQSKYVESQRKTGAKFIRLESDKVRLG